MLFRTELLLAFIAIFATQTTNSQDPLTHPDQQLQPALTRTKRMFAMCPPKFEKIGNECYFISSFKVNWLDAHFECKDRNSKLAEPMKFEDRQLRKNLVRGDVERADLWIGGIYNWERNKWQWGYNGKDIKYQSFSQMRPGSSHDLRFHCAVLNPDLKYRWSARMCVEKNHFICQHRMPYVNEKNRIKVYEKWNQTYPNELVNEVEVKVAGDSSNRKRDYYRIQNQRRRSSNPLRRVNNESFIGNVQQDFDKSGKRVRNQKIGQRKINNEVSNDLNPIEQGVAARHDNSRRRRKHKFHQQANLPDNLGQRDFRKDNIKMTGNDVMEPMVIEDAPDPMQEMNTLPKLKLQPAERPLPRRRKNRTRRPTNSDNETLPQGTTTTRKRPMSTFVSATVTTTDATVSSTSDSLQSLIKKIEQNEVTEIEENVDRALNKLEKFDPMPDTTLAAVEVTTTTTTITTESPSTTTAESATHTPASSTHEPYGIATTGLSVEEEKKFRREELRKRLQKLSPEQQRRFFELRKLRKARKSNDNETPSHSHDNETRE